MKTRETSSKLRALQSFAVGSLPIVIYNASADDRFVGPRYLNGSIAAATGFDAEEFIGNESLWPSRIHHDDLPLVSARLASLAVGETLLIEYRWLCADGSMRRFLDHGIVESRYAGAAAVSGICLDVTAAGCQAEAQTSSSGNLQTVAHELNNMISVIVWNLEPLAKSLQDAGKSFDRTQYALQAAARCIELIQQLSPPRSAA